MFNIIFRVLIIYVVVIFVMRLMGKRQIGEMEPFELVITLIIADLATIPMAEASIPIWYGIVPLLVITIVHFVVSILTKKSSLIRDVISGKPVIVVDSNGIVFQELKKLNISCEELLESLRNLDYFDMSEINYAIIERTGKITVIPKTSSMPATRKDLQLVKPETDVFYAIVENKKVIYKNFKEMGLLHDVVMPEILRYMSCTLKEIAFCTLSEGGDVYIQKFGEVCKSFKIQITREAYTAKKLQEKAHDGNAVSTLDQQTFASPKNSPARPKQVNPRGAK